MSEPEQSDNDVANVPPPVKLGYAPPKPKRSNGCLIALLIIAGLILLAGGICTAYFANLHL